MFYTEIKEEQTDCPNAGFSSSYKYAVAQGGLNTTRKQAISDAIDQSFYEGIPVFLKINCGKELKIDPSEFMEAYKDKKGTFNQKRQWFIKRLLLRTAKIYAATELLDQNSIKRGINSARYYVQETPEYTQFIEAKKTHALEVFNEISTQAHSKVMDALMLLWDAFDEHCPNKQISNKLRSLGYCEYEELSAEAKGEIKLLNDEDRYDKDLHALSLISQCVESASFVFHYHALSHYYKHSGQERPITPIRGKFSNVINPDALRI